MSRRILFYYMAVPLFLQITLLRQLSNHLIDNLAISLAL